MEILTDNYIWLIIIVVVILMTIIGYIAEKTDFGKKEFSKRKNTKKEVKQEKVEVAPEVKEEPQVEMRTVEVSEPEAPVMQDAPVFDDTIKAEEMSFEMPKTESFDTAVSLESEPVEFGDPLADDMAIASDFSESYNLPLNTVDTNERFEVPEELSSPFGDAVAEEPISEDLNAPFGDMKVTSFNEDLNAPLMDSPSTIEEDLNVPFGDNARMTSNSFNLDLPDIDSIKEEVNTSSSDSEDDDIWKF